MAVELANAYVSLVVSAKGIGAQLEKELGGPVEAAAKKAGDSATQQFALTGKQVTKFGLGALAVAGAVGAGLFKVGKSASDLGESVNAVHVTFGKAADGILKLGEGAAKSMGLSNTAFNGMAVQFSNFATTIAGKGGDVVGVLGGLTQRAADFASVLNLDVAEAGRVFQSALAGETEPIRKYGIDLSAATVTTYAYANGIGVVGTELTEAQKVQARYGLLMQSTAKDQGDFANTSGSAANAMRIAKAEAENAAASLGAVVAPAMAFAAGKAADLASGFVHLNDATGGWLVKGVAVVGAGAGVIGVFSVVAGQVMKAHDSFVKIKGAMTNAEGGLTGMGKAASLAGKALFAAGAAIAALEVANKLTEDSKGATAAMNKLIVSLDGIAKAGKKPAETLQAFSDAALKLENKKGGIAKAIDAFGSGFDSSALKLQAFQETFDELASKSPEQAHQVADALLDMQAAAKGGQQAAIDWLDSFGLSDKAIGGLVGQLDAATGATKVLSSATDANATATGLTAAAQKELDDQAKAVSDSLTKESDALKAQVSAMRSAADATFAVQDATDTYAKFTDELSKKIADAKGNQDEINALYREGTQDAAAIADAVVRMGKEHATATGATFSATQQQDAWNREMLFSAMNAVPAQRDAILGYIADANGIPKSKTTDIEALIVEGRFEEAAARLAEVSKARDAAIIADADDKSIAVTQSKLDELAKPITVMVKVQGYTVPKGFQGPLVPLSSNIPVPGNAAGTSSWRGGLTWLAEDGPELVDLPRGTVVHNAADTSAILAASSSMMALANGGGNSGLPPINVTNNGRDFTVADMNHVLAMARLA